MKRILFLVAFITGFGLVAEAQQYKISVQGTLKDANGQALEDGEVDVTFRLYDVQTGGSSVWQEAATITLQGGVYSHKLGSVTNLSPTIFGSTLYLGVTTSGGQELEPRTELTYAPYAVSVGAAQEALKISEVGCSGAVGDIKFSILTPVLFQQENGDCWVPMNGDPIPMGNKLRDAYNFTEVPDMSGYFIRAVEYNSTNVDSNTDVDEDRLTTQTQVGTIQDEQFKSHNHTMQNAGSHSHTAQETYVSYLRQEQVNGVGTTFLGDVEQDRNGAGGFVEQDGGGNEGLAIGQRTDPESTTTNGDHTHTISTNGGSETRPDNRAFFIYIRIN